LIPILKNTGVTVKERVCLNEGINGSKVYMASGTGRSTVRAVLDPITLGNGN
jgi:hypothetical protein